MIWLHGNQPKKRPGPDDCLWWLIVRAQNRAKPGKVESRGSRASSSIDQKILIPDP